MARGRASGLQLDDEAMLAIAVLALVGLGLAALLLRRWGLLAGSHLELGRVLASGFLRAALHRFAIASVVAAGLVVALLALRLVWSLHTLRSRVAYAVLPPPSFDVRPEAIEVFGQQLLGARRRVLAWLDRPACAVRIRLTTTPAGRVLYVVELPRRFRSSLFNAYATAYPGVQLVPVAEVDRPKETSA
jgi:hypothetical protein